MGRMGGIFPAETHTHTHTGHRTIIGSNYSKEIVANLLLAQLHPLWPSPEREWGAVASKYRVSIIAETTPPLSRTFARSTATSCQVISIYKQLIFPSNTRDSPRIENPFPSSFSILGAEMCVQPVCGRRSVGRRMEGAGGLESSQPQASVEKCIRHPFGSQEADKDRLLRALQIRVEHFRLDAIVFGLPVLLPNLFPSSHILSAQTFEAGDPQEATEGCKFLSQQIDRLPNCSSFGQSQGNCKALRK